MQMQLFFSGAPHEMRPNCVSTINVYMEMIEMDHFVDRDHVGDNMGSRFPHRSDLCLIEYLYRNRITRIIFGNAVHTASLWSLERWASGTH